MFHTYPYPSIYQNSCIIAAPPSTLCSLYHSYTTRHTVLTESFLHHPVHNAHCIIPVPPGTLCSLYHSCTTRHTVLTVSFLHHPAHCAHCIIPAPPGTLCSLYHSCTTRHTVLTVCSLYHSCTNRHTVLTVSFLYHPAHCAYCIIPAPPSTLCSLYHSCTTQKHVHVHCYCTCTTRHTVPLYIIPVPPETLALFIVLFLYYLAGMHTYLLHYFAVLYLITHHIMIKKVDMYHDDTGMHIHCEQLYIGI